MPVVFRENGFRFHFYANEGNPREPMHVHVLRDGVEAKFWLWPFVRVAYNDGYSARVLRELTEIAERRRHEIVEVWDEFFGQGQ